MYARRNRRTDLDIVNAGDFAKIGKKHFRHTSGTEIKYDCNRWAWEVDGDLYTTLEVAAYAVRHKAKEVAAA